MDISLSAATTEAHRIFIKIDEYESKRNPLHLVTDTHARLFFKEYNFKIEEGVLIRGILAVKYRATIEGRFDNIGDASRHGLIEGSRFARRLQWIRRAWRRFKKGREQFKTALRPSEETELPFELKIGDWEYSKLEVETLYHAWMRGKWETLLHLSRQHWLLIVACIFAAMTQGWDQAAMAGAAIEAMNDLGKPFVSTAAYDLTPTSDDNNLPLGANTWWLGFAVGAPFLCGAFLGLFFTDRLPELWRFGRRGAIIVAGTCSFISVIGCAASHNFWEFLAFRIILGAGMAGKAAIVPIWLSETSPRNVRGVLLVCWQLFVACGIAAGSVANLSLYRLNPSESWRYMFISAFIPALLLFSMVLFAPESPRWLLKRSGFKKSEKLSDFEFEKRRKGLVRAALKSLSQLHGKPTNMLAAGELYLLYMRLLQEQDFLKKENDDQSHSKFNEHASREATNEFTSKVAVTGHASGVAVNMHSTEARVNGDTPAAVVNENRSTIIDNQGQQSIKAPHNTPIEYVSWGQRWRLMISTRRMTRANGAAAAVMIAQQLCGINLLAFLAGTFFRNSFFSNSQNPTLQDNTKHLWLSFAFGVVNFLFTIPALFYIDRSEGRRTLLNWSFPCMFATLLISGLILRKSTNDSATGRVGTGAGIAYIVLLMLFTAAYSIGEGPAAFVISAEVFPLTNRELGMSLAVFWNFLGAGVLALCAPAMTRNLGQDNTLFFFSGMNILAWFLCYWLVPNTGSEDLEDIFEQLEAPTHFVFVYTCAILLRKAFRGLEWCHGAGCRSWKNCGFIQLETAEDEYKEHVGQDADWKAMIKSFWGKAFRKGARRHT